MINPFDLIQAAIPDFAPNREMAIFFDPASKSPWQVEVINDCMFVMLGEVSGEVTAHGVTMEEAVLDAVSQLKALTKESFK